MQTNKIRTAKCVSIRVKMHKSYAVHFSTCTNHKPDYWWSMFDSYRL